VPCALPAAAQLHALGRHAHVDARSWVRCAARRCDGCGPAARGRTAQRCCQSERAGARGLAGTKGDAAPTLLAEAAAAFEEVQLRRETAQKEVAQLGVVSAQDEEEARIARLQSGMADVAQMTAEAEAAGFTMACAGTAPQLGDNALGSCTTCAHMCVAFGAGIATALAGSPACFVIQAKRTDGACQLRGGDVFGVCLVARTDGRALTGASPAPSAAGALSADGLRLLEDFASALGREAKAAADFLWELDTAQRGALTSEQLARGLRSIGALQRPSCVAAQSRALQRRNPSQR
jgi:hypothetical protein